MPRLALDFLAVAPRLFAAAGPAIARARGARAVVVDTLRRTCARFDQLPEEFVDAHVQAEAARMVEPDAYLGYLEAWADLGVVFRDTGALESMVRSITSPTLLIHGAEDRVVSPLAARRLMELQPGWRLEMLEGVGHNPNFEAPEISARLIQEWAGAVRCRSGAAVCGEGDRPLRGHRRGQRRQFRRRAG